jgi:hypothetical protein
MKKIDTFENFDSSFPQSKKEIISICKKFRIKNYTINDDGSVDVDGDVDLSNNSLSKLPLKFGIVRGDFYCFHNKLTTLEGSPKEVGRTFWCNYNNLDNLNMCPQIVGSLGGNLGDFVCSNNKLTSIIGAPREVFGFYCSHNKLTNLEGIPKLIGRGGLGCESNKISKLYRDLELTSCEGPFKIGYNPIFQVYKLFNDFKKFKTSLDWNYFKDDGTIYLDRFNDALEEAGINIINGYKFI